MKAHIATVQRYLQSPGMSLTGSDSGLSYLSWDVTAATVIHGILLVGAGDVSLGLQFFRCAEAGISSVTLFQERQRLPIRCSSLSLKVRPKCPACLRAFIPIESQPMQAAYDLRRMLWSRTL